MNRDEALADLRSLCTYYRGDVFEAWLASLHARGWGHGSELVEALGKEPHPMDTTKKAPPPTFSTEVALTASVHLQRIRKAVGTMPYGTALPDTFFRGGIGQYADPATVADLLEALRHVLEGVAARDRDQQEELATLRAFRRAVGDAVIEAATDDKVLRPVVREAKAAKGKRA